MEINSSSSVASTITQQVNRQTAVDKQQQDIRAQEQRRADLQDEQNNQSQQQTQRIQADEQAIAFVEQTLNTQASNNSTPNNQSGSSTSYDEPVESNRSAVAAYQSVSDISQRDNIKEVFGVDLYA